MADMNKIRRIDGGTLKTQRAQDATIPLNVQTYDGSYTVTPTREQQTLETRNRMMTNNVTVEAAAITTDYDELENKPQINSVTLQGNVGLDELGIPTIASVEDKYTVPEGGIPASDLASGVIPDVSGFYVKPESGIPADDIAAGVIPDVSGKLDAPSAAGTLGQVLTSDGEGGQTWEDPTGGGTNDYTDLDNKPQINSVTLSGNKSLSDLGIASASDLADKQAKITASGILKGDGSGGVTAATAGTDYGTYSKPSGGIPSTDMASAVQTSLGKADSAYQLPSGGMTSSDMASAVQTSLGKADTAYQKPSGGIPSTDMTSAVQTSLGKADTAYQKPSGGIPGTDLASGVIPDISGKLDAPSTAGTNGQVLTSNGSGGQTWQTISGLLPSVSSSDNGKFLRVSNGAWAAETVPTAVGVSF